ncbi:hypothetical protein ACFE04_031285 [Oxalis oulophora]
MEVSKLLSTKFVKIKNTKFLVPFSIFSIVLSYLTFLIVTLQVSIQIDKNYMFLLCNGILVLIAKNSGFMISSCTSEDESTTTTRVQLKNEVKIVNNNVIKPKILVVEEESEKTRLLVEEDNKAVTLSINDSEEDEAINIDSFEEIEEGFDQFLSIEELNKRCEAFIRKMKEDIKFEV